MAIASRIAGKMQQKNQAKEKIKEEMVSRTQGKMEIVDVLKNS